MFLSCISRSLALDTRNYFRNYSLDLLVTYLDQLRIDCTPNKLVQCVHRGLQDKYILAALCSRALTWICEIEPMRRTVNEWIDRRYLRPAFDTLLETIQSDEPTQTGEQHIDQGCTTRLLEKFAAKYPQFKEQIDAHIKRVALDNRIVVTIANE